jgi:hypothetical protein
VEAWLKIACGSSVRVRALLLEVASGLVHSHVRFQVIEANLVAVFPSTPEPLVIFLLLPAWEKATTPVKRLHGTRKQVPALAPQPGNHLFIAESLLINSVRASPSELPRNARECASDGQAQRMEKGRCRRLNGGSLLWRGLLRQVHFEWQGTIGGSGISPVLIRLRALAGAAQTSEQGRAVHQLGSLREH